MNSTQEMIEEAKAQHFAEPFRTIALLCVCFGLRISECLGLKWGDVDWLNGKLQIERGIVCQNVDDVKTINSERAMSIAAGLLTVLTAWKQTAQFSGDGDWMFASPVKIGRSAVFVLPAFCTHSRRQRLRRASAPLEHTA